MIEKYAIIVHIMAINAEQLESHKVFQQHGILINKELFNPLNKKAVPKVVFLEKVPISHHKNLEKVPILLPVRNKIRT